MSSRNSRPAPSRSPVTPVYRGPQAISQGAPYGSPPYIHAPNAALLIDFDNVTMGIRSDLGNELRTLLSSDIIKGKVAVQRAYADWRRYPQYIVPLTEASIDLVWAPAYGSSKKNATDIRLAIDALELVFTRPEIGTFILLSGDSDFSSLVIKLKEYGKYVIGVGIRESSSDLLVMNCDEYYSYNALAGLVKAGEDEKVSRDPWELVVEAVARMKRNGDVMRSDRLKQVMQDIDATFDEKNLGMAKFSRFVQEAAQRGLLKITRLENGQMEVDVAEPEPIAAVVPEPRPVSAPVAEPERQNGVAADEVSRGRGRRGRGRARRGAAGETADRETTAGAAGAAPSEAAALPAEMSGERLTRDEALDLVRRAVLALSTSEDEAVPASAVRRKARELLGRDSESLNERFFHRILRDAHDADLIDLRKRGDDYEVARAATAEPIAQQLAATAPAAPSTPAPSPAEPGASQAARSAATAAALRRGIRHRGIRSSRPVELPPELLSIGVVDTALTRPADTGARTEETEQKPAARKSRRGRRGSKTTKAAAETAANTEQTTPPAPQADPAPDGESESTTSRPRSRRSRSRKKTTTPAASDG